MQQELRQTEGLSIVVSCFQGWERETENGWLGGWGIREPGSDLGPGNGKKSQRTQLQEQKCGLYWHKSQLTNPNFFYRRTKCAFRENIY